MSPISGDYAGQTPLQIVKNTIYPLATNSSIGHDVKEHVIRLLLSAMITELEKQTPPSPELLVYKQEAQNLNFKHRKSLLRLKMFGENKLNHLENEQDPIKKLACNINAYDFGENILLRNVASFL